MAKEILVGQYLTDSMIDAGANLVEQVRKSDLRVVAAFWLYFEEAEEWRLVLVSKRLHKDGPLALYEELSNLLYDEARRERYGISLINTTFMDAGDNLVRSLASVPHGGQLLENRRLTGFAFKGTYVPDIYV